MNREYALYLARAISAVGDWMTFLAVALMVNEKYGSDKVAYTFLISSLPALFLSGNAYKLIPVVVQKLVYFCGIVALAFNVLLLTKADQLWQVYAYLIVAATISALMRPLLETLTAEAFAKEELNRILTRVGGLVTSILCVAPPLGASLGALLGYNSVFVIDAATYLLSAGILLFVFRSTGPKKSESEEEATPIFKKQTFRLKELGYPSRLKAILVVWYVVLILGALINAGEFGAFTEFGYDKFQVGVVVGCWGFGGLLAFLAGGVNLDKYLPALAPAYGIALATFYFVPIYAASCVIFVVAGFLAAKVGGMIKSQIQLSIPDTIRPLEVWGLVNSRLSLINMSVYGTVGYLIPFYGVGWVVVPILGATLFSGFLLLRSNTRLD